MLGVTNDIISHEIYINYVINIWKIVDKKFFIFVSFPFSHIDTKHLVVPKDRINCFNSGIKA